MRQLMGLLWYVLVCCGIGVVITILDDEYCMRLVGNIIGKGRVPHLVRYCKNIMSLAYQSKVGHFLSTPWDGRQ